MADVADVEFFSELWLAVEAWGAAGYGDYTEVVEGGDDVAGAGGGLAEALLF